MVDAAQQDSELLFGVGALTGLDTTTAPFDFDLNSGLVPDMENIVPASNYGGFSTALGRKNMFSNTLPAPPTGGFVWHRPGGLPDIYLFYVTDASGLGQLYSATLGGALTKITSYPDATVTGYPANMQAYFVTAQQWCFIAVSNGPTIKLDQNLKVTYWGIGAPITAPAAVSPSNQSGNLLGFYNYCCTFGRSAPAQESSQGAITLAQVAALSQRADISITGSGTGATAGVTITVAINGTQVASYTTAATDSVGYVIQQLQTQIAANAYARSLVTIGAPNLTLIAALPGAGGNSIQVVVTSSNTGAYAFTPSSGYMSGGSTGGYVQLSAIPQPTDPQVDTIYLYRIGGAIGQWRLIASLAVGTTTFTDNIADANVTGQALVVYRDVPPQFTCIASHQGRIFGFGTASDPSSVWFSNYNEPWGFNSATGVLHADYMGFGDSAVVCGSIGSVLVLLKQRSYYTVWGSTDADFQVIFNEDTGCAAARSLVCTKGQARWLSKRGVVFSDGQSTQYVSAGSYRVSNIKSVLDGLTANTRVGCAAFYSDHAYHLSIPTLGKTYRYDEKLNSWWKLAWAFSIAITDTESDVDVIAADTVGGEIDQWFADKYDRGGAITAFVTSPIYTGELGATKEGEYVRIEGPQQPPGTQCTYTITANTGAVNANPPDNRPAALQTFTGIVPLDGSVSGGLNVRQDRLPKSIMGYDLQITVSVSVTQQTYIGKIGVYGSVKRRLGSLG